VITSTTTSYFTSAPTPASRAGRARIVLADLATEPNDVRAAVLDLVARQTDRFPGLAELIAEAAIDVTGASHMADAIAELLPTAQKKLDDLWAKRRAECAEHHRRLHAIDKEIEAATSQVQHLTVAQWPTEARDIANELHELMEAREA
jgi:hypothetical protein